MKFINKFKSFSFDKRKKSKINYVIIHYTALENCEKAISHLCNENNKVSSHFIISQKGQIYTLVNEKYRAWHAGVSSWNGESDLNSSSIGIELDYSLKYKNNKFSKNMMRSLSLLLTYILKKYKINNRNVLGHSDIAPFRKKDPGKYFPWKFLYNKNIAFCPDKKNKIYLKILNKWFEKYHFSSKKKIILLLFNFIGYDTSLVVHNNYLFKKLIIAYQTHFIQSNINGIVDDKTFTYIKIHFLTLVLKKL